MNHYVNWLHQVAKLVYLIGNYQQTAKLKKLLDSTDPKNKIFFRCFEEFPENSLKKIKLEGAKQGILRADWLNKTLERYPEMVIFMFNCGQELEMDLIEQLLKQILKKINLFTIDVLKANNKQEVIFKVVVTLTKAQYSNPLLVDKVNYYMKSYEKDSYAICMDNLAKDVAKYRYTWLNNLAKNYEKKALKLKKKLQETVSQEKRICYSFKLAVVSQLVGREEKQRYNQLYNSIKVKFSDLTSKEFNFLKYLQIRELRLLADLAVLRSVKGRILSHTKDIPQFIQNHLNFFKMRSLDPNSSHFYYYHQELVWRATFLQQVLQILGTVDVVELLPRNVIAQWLNGLLSYLFRLSTINGDLLEGLGGQILSMTKQNYLGRYDYDYQVTDADIVMTETSQLLSHQKDLISKGIQLITRYKSSSLFKQNEINFLNIYLIRFHLADGKYSAITEIYHQILKVEVNRCNYFLINELFKTIQDHLPKVDSYSRKFLYGVASLICDYFQNIPQLNKYLELFLNEHQTPRLIDTQPVVCTTDQPETHIFKLKKNSNIFSARILITQQIILGNDKYQLKLRMFLGHLLRDRLKTGKELIRLKFNHPGMVHEFPIQLGQDQGQWVDRDVDLQPLYYIHKDAVFHIAQVQLIMGSQNLIWLLERSQLVFERYDSTMFHSKIRQPQIDISGVKKLYYLNENFAFSVVVRGIQDCKVSAKVSVVEDDDNKTQLFLNKDEKTDITNSKRFQELEVGTVGNVFWVKCNKLGMKVVKLLFNITVSWRDKPLNIKSTYNNTVRQVRFNVLNMFTITKTFREAISGSYAEAANIPLHKKMLLCFNVKVNDHIEVTEITHHNNPRTVKYYKNFKMINFHLAPADSVKLNLLFQLPAQCLNQFDLFLTTLFIKWRRQGSPLDNITLDDHTIVHPLKGSTEVSFNQKKELVRKERGSIFIRVKNLWEDANNMHIQMDSNDNLLRIGEKGKWKLLNGFQTHQFEFNVLCLRGGIFQLPSVRVFANNQEIKVSTANFLVYCK